MSKRRFSDDEKNSKKRNFPNIELKNSISYKIEVNTLDLPNDTEASAIYLKNNFPVESFENRLPPLLLHHQLYSLIKDVTRVDLDVKRLNEDHKLVQFELSRDHDGIVLIFIDDLKDYIQRVCDKNELIEKFINKILMQIPGFGIDREQLFKILKIKEKGASELMNAGLLVSIDSENYHYSFPNAGLFMKHLIRGRKSLIKTISKSKYGEILQQELEKRKLDKSTKLGIKFHIHDVIGANLVLCTNTTSGLLLRYKRD